MTLKNIKTAIDLHFEKGEPVITISDIEANETIVSVKLSPEQFTQMLSGLVRVSVKETQLGNLSIIGKKKITTLVEVEIPEPALDDTMNIHDRAKAVWAEEMGQRENIYKSRFVSVLYGKDKIYAQGFVEEIE